MSLIFRCSSLHRLMGNAQSIDPSLLNEYILKMKKLVDLVVKRKKQEDFETVFCKMFLEEYNLLKLNSLSTGAKSLVKDMVRKKKHNAPSKFSGSKETAKGHAVEEDAIQFLMQQEFISAEKNTIRFNNDWLTGEPDIITDDCIYDTKCPYTYWTMDYFPEDIESKALDAGYDWQQLGYLWLLRENDEFNPKIIDRAELKFILMPTPQAQLTKYDNDYLHVEFVENMNPKDRITTYRINWDQSKIELIKLKIAAARKYAETLVLG